MTPIETLIYDNNIKNKIIASDLDGTLLWGDLGETVFFLILAMKAAGAASEDLPAFLARVNKSDVIKCGQNPEIADVLSRYFTHMQKAELVQAYTLIDAYLSTSNMVDIHAFSSTVLSLGIPRRDFFLQLGERVFTLPVHAMHDPLMSRLLKDSYTKGADIRIISGSPQSVVEGYCLFQGLPRRFARGISKDQDGKVVVPFGEKKLGILANEGFTRPYIVVGNSSGDYDMLRAALHPFVRKSSPQGVLEEAKRNHWELI